MANRINFAVFAAAVLMAVMLFVSHGNNAALEAQRDSVIVALAHNDSLLSDYAATDTALAAELITLQDSLSASATTLNNTRHYSRLLADSLITSLLRGDTVEIVQIVTVVDTLIAEADACNDALGTCNRVSELWKVRYTNCNTAFGVCKSDRVSLETLYLDVSKRSLFERFSDALPWMAGTAIVVLVVR